MAATLLSGWHSAAHAIPADSGSQLRAAPPIARIEVVSVSPRDVDVSPADEFDEVASGINVVGVGQKVYLEAEPIDGAVAMSYDWSLVLQPAGSTAMLDVSTGQMTTFRPDVRGLYHVQLISTDSMGMATDPVIQTVRAGTWVGAGVFDTHAPPDPTIPECANPCCHGGSNIPRLNVLDQWLSSNHAQKLQNHLGGHRGSEYEESCLACHTVGFDQAMEAENHGFDDIAFDLGYDLAQIPVLIADAVANGTDNWPQLPAELQGHASVQCESCHGPGSQHLGNLVEMDRGVGGVDLSPKQCAQCHDSLRPEGDRFYQWSASTHPLTADLSEGHVAETASCIKCHTGEGFVAIIADGGSLAAPVEDAHGVTCSTCHDPHNSTNPHQLRVVGDTAFSSGQTYVEAGIGGLCMNCHQSRISNAESTALSSTRGAHHGPQGDILLGINAVSFGLPYVGNSAHTTIVKDTCTACHMAESPVAGAEVGSHSFSMRDESGTPGVPGDDILNTANTCEQCHDNAVGTYDIESRGDYDGDGATEGLQTEVDGLFTLLRTRILATYTGVTLDASGKLSVTSGGFATLTDNQKRAFYNYNILWEDGSKGVHNTSYTVQALQRSYFGAYGHSILDDFPEIDLRGPVQPAAALPPTPTATPIPTPAPDDSLVRIEIRSVSPREVAFDQTGTLDEVASGLSAVGVGTKVYLEALKLDDTVSTVTWSIATRPAGSTAPLSDVNAEQVTFRPDANGRYVVRLTAESAVRGTLSYDQNLYAGQWVGVGIFNTHATPTPHAPECATSFCHGGNNAEARLGTAPEWVKSNHAQKLQNHLGGERGSHYAESCLPCHTVGFDANVAADNGGFDDIASDIMYDLAQIPALVEDAATNHVDNWPQLPAELQGHASVQCESCHGAGSNHLINLLADDHGISGVNLDPKQCAQCHDSESGFQQKFYQWTSSSHPLTADLSEGHVAETASCVKCHTGEGFVDVQVNHAPAQPKPEAHGITCSACHDPHYSEEPHQLRLAGDFMLDSGAMSYGTGTGGLCYRCHNSRVANAEVTALTSSRGAHHGPQADMFLGTSGVSFGLPFEQSSAHTIVVPDSCAGCHMAEPVDGGPGQPTPPLVGSHTFSLRDTMGTEEVSDDITNHENACSRCHQDITSLDYPSMGDYDGDGVVEGTQTEVDGLFDILRAGILANFAGASDNEGNISMSSSDFANLEDDQKRALYNFRFVWEDGSKGVHNTSFAVQLLQRSYFGVFGTPIDQVFPNIDLRGPVQPVEMMATDAVLVR